MNRTLFHVQWWPLVLVMMMEEEEDDGDNDDYNMIFLLSIQFLLEMFF